MIPNYILKKPAKLSDDEYEIMKQHAYYTYLILKDLKGMKNVAKWASHHHEKLDGKGYPFGLSAKQLSLEERMLCCCDIYQALTEERAYKKGFPHEKAIAILQEGVDKGEIDGDILSELDKVFKNYNEKDEDTVTEILKSAP